jgi:uncharacterized membrane protein
MNRHSSALSTLSIAIGLALAASPPAVRAANPQPGAKDKATHLEKCYGINRVGKNDCASGAHSCAGEASRARDPKSYVEVPVGACSKIEGGSLKPT